jgi:isopentenyl phosphate kinase
MGGSVVTFKDRPESANYSAIEGVARAISLLQEIPMIMVHGGGSFGHYWSVRYNMHTRPGSYDTHGISIVHESMIKLNQIIVNSLIKNGLNPYTISVFALTSGNKPLTPKINQIHTIAQTGLVPVTFGDIIHISDGNYSILSGDVIMTMIAKILKPSKVIFAVNTELTKANITDSRSVRFAATSHTIADITGGMCRKVKEGFKIASRGLDVMIVNGLKPEKITQAVRSGPEDFQGTVIRGRSNRLKKG